MFSYKKGVVCCCERKFKQTPVVESVKLKLKLQVSGGGGGGNPLIVV